MVASFKMTYSSDAGRIGILRVNNKKIETPAMFFQYPFRDYIFFWNDVSIRGLLVNAHFLMRKRALLERVQRTGIKNFLKFDGVVMMDSGGHQIQKYGYAIDACQISKVYNTLNPDIGVVLDRPIHPGFSQISIHNAVDYMIQNYYVMKSTTKVTLLPVIHGYSKKVIEKCIKEIPSLFWGVGSLVPLILGKSSNVIGDHTVVGVKNGKKILIETICFIRKILGEEVFLHVFGIGSALTMHLMLYLGVDSVDSASYEWFARYGHIQLPGKGRINITGYAHEKCSEHRTINWKEYECDCPICLSTPKHELLSIFRKSKDARTIHNLHVHAKEMELARERIKENSYELFVEKRFEGTQFYKLFKYAKRLKNNFH